MSQENMELIRDAYRRVNGGGFAALADLLDPRFEMDAPQGVESSQAHDKEGLGEWFRKMDEIWEELRFDPKEMTDLDEAREHITARWRPSSAVILNLCRDGGPSATT